MLRCSCREAVESKAGGVDIDGRARRVVQTSADRIALHNAAPTWLWTRNIAHAFAGT